MYSIKASSKIINCKIEIPYSKSESNRVLIIRALCKEPFNISNLSTSDDTVALQSLLSSNEYLLNCGSGGTTFRFLLAYLALIGDEKIITGNERLRSRPVMQLVNALNSLGANITYLEKEGFAPLKVSKGNFNAGNEIAIEANVSSQFISALLLIAPILPNGLKLFLLNKTLSLPYIHLTLNVMQQFGVHHTFTGNLISLSHQEYKPFNYKVKGDWSSASYFYAMAAIANKADIFFEGLSFNSSQADEVIADIMIQFGIKSEAVNNGIRIKKVEALQLKQFEYDFSNCPDLAQTLAFVCAALGLKAQLTGLDNLSFKETDRINAIKTEIEKMHTGVFANENSIVISENSTPVLSDILFHTYADHRMIMAITPLALIGNNILIDEFKDVTKSFPGFWFETQKAGFVLK